MRIVQKLEKVTDGGWMIANLLTDCLVIHDRICKCFESTDECLVRHIVPLLEDTGDHDTNNLLAIILQLLFESAKVILGLSEYSHYYLTYYFHSILSWWDFGECIK